MHDAMTAPIPFPSAPLIPASFETSVKVPLASVVLVVTWVASYFTVIFLLEPKPLPATTTLLPTFPLVVFIVAVGTIVKVNVIVLTWSVAVIR